MAPHSPSPASSKTKVLFIRLCFSKYQQIAVAFRTFEGAQNQHGAELQGKPCSAAFRSVNTSMHLLVMDELITSAMVSGSCCCSSASSCLSPRCLEACKQLPGQLICASITFLFRAKYVCRWTLPVHQQKRSCKNVNHSIGFVRRDAASEAGCI